MVCDLMLAISKGAVRPTRIMQRANLTWNSLLMYLNALAVNGLVRREERKSVSSYHLTDKGRETLEAYVALKERLGPLKLENVNTKALVKALTATSGPKPVDESRAAQAAKLTAEGYRVLPRVARGKSGVDHEFGVVAKSPQGPVHAYVFAPAPDEQLILGLFVKQLDTGFKLHVIHSGSPTPRAVERAKEYGIELSKAGATRTPADQDHSF